MTVRQLLIALLWLLWTAAIVIWANWIEDSALLSVPIAANLWAGLGFVLLAAFLCLMPATTIELDWRNQPD